MARPKFRNKKVEIDGIKYDSILESKRGVELIRLERAGKIQNLRRQVRYNLVVNDNLVCWYKSDFDYDVNGRHVTEDVKSAFTAKMPAFRIKAKLFKAVFGYPITIWPPAAAVD